MNCQYCLKAVPFDYTLQDQPNNILVAKLHKTTHKNGEVSLSCTPCSLVLRGMVRKFARVNTFETVQRFLSRIDNPYITKTAAS